MGCHLSRKNDTDTNPRVFKVFNVDDQWTELSAGKIEITDTNLILYQKGKEAIHWPLRSLRRYGFDAELFSFESGRRCPTGPGIYAFKCRRADALFNLLQDSIQRAGEEEQQQRTIIVEDSGGSQHGGLLTHQQIVIHQQSDGSPNPGQYVQPLSIAESRAVHAAAQASGAAAVAAAPGGAGEVAGAVGGVVDGHSPHHYVNGDVALGNGHSRSALFLPANPMHDYVNTAVALPTTKSSGKHNHVTQRSASVDMSQVRVDLGHSLNGGARIVERNNSEGQVITYAILDLPPSKDSVNKGTPGTPCHAAIAHNGSAVMIDLASSQATYVNVPASDTQSNAASAYGPAATEYRASVASLGNGAVRKVPPSLQHQSSSKDDLHSYANLDLVTAPSPAAVTNGYHHHATAATAIAAATAPQQQQQQPHTQAPRPEPRKHKVNYIQLDLKGSSDNLSNGAVPPASPISTTSVPESPSRRTESYATIDFHKTAALSNSGRSSNDEGFRKTRHNSNIEELN